jgi:hypothetical protein
VGVFACQELSQDGPVAIGKTDTHVCVRVGPWAFFLAIDAGARFPDTQAVIPAAAAGATTCRLSAADVAFLVKALPRLPGREDDNAPLTLDLSGQVAVRARAEGQERVTEVLLCRSEVVGPPVRLVCNRQYLARAVALGFTEFRVTKPDVPVASSDRSRTYVWMPLGQDGALPPGDDVLRIASASDESATAHAQKERRQEPMTKPHADGQGNGHPPLPPASASATDPAPNGTGLGALVEEAQALKEVLHDAYGRSARLVAALKRQKKQSRLMASTLASLRQLQRLQSVDG